jgi:hypothetical protein
LSSHQTLNILNGENINNMVLNQCIVKGCHSTSSVENLQVGCGGHLHPIPTEVTQDLQLEKKWIELVKVIT